MDIALVVAHDPKISLPWKIRWKALCPAIVRIAANHRTLRWQREGRMDAHKAPRRHELPVGIQDETSGSPLMHDAPTRPGIVFGARDKSLESGQRQRQDAPLPSFPDIGMPIGRRVTIAIGFGLGQGIGPREQMHSPGGIGEKPEDAERW